MLLNNMDKMQDKNLKNMEKKELERNLWNFKMQEENLFLNKEYSYYIG
jgi:hypothetical protein